MEKRPPRRTPPSPARDPMTHHRDGSTRFTFPTILAAIALCGTMAACDGVVAPEAPAASGAAPRSSGLISGGYQANGLITGGYNANGLITGGYNASVGDSRSQGLISGGY